jgi:hypothetical protein
MEPHREEPQKAPEAGAEQRPKRFRIVKLEDRFRIIKLEERVAPRHSPRHTMLCTGFGCY